MRTYVAVDGGMSDNLRPMLYGSRYEALIADRAGRRRRTRPVTVAGMHCESSDVLVRDAELAAPRAGDVLVTPATGAYGHAMANNYNGVPRPPVIFCRDGDARVVVRRETYDDLTGARRCLSRAAHRRPRAGAPSAAPSPSCSPSAPTQVEAIAGRRPELAGVLRRSEGDFDEILADSDIVVELIGGTDPARDYVLRALAGRQARRHRQQAADRPARRRAVRGGARGRRPAALRGRGRRRRAGDPGDPGEPRRDRDRRRSSGSSTGRPTSSSPRWRRPAPSYDDALARAQELGYAEADPTDDVGGADAAAKMAILARLAFDTPVGLDDVSYEGITEIQPDDLAYAKELGLSLKLLGVAERRGERDQRPRLPLLPLRAATRWRRSRARSTRSWSRRRRSPRSRCPGPGAGGHETATAVLGDVVSILSGEAPVAPAGASGSRSSATSAPRSTSTSRSPTGPACSPRIADVLGQNEISVQSVVQRGLGDDARLVMVMHEAPRARFYAALEEIASSTSCARRRARSG